MMIKNGGRERQQRLKFKRNFLKGKSNISLYYYYSNFNLNLLKPRNCKIFILNNINNNNAIYLIQLLSFPFFFVRLIHIGIKLSTRSL